MLRANRLTAIWISSPVISAVLVSASSAALAAGYVSFHARARTYRHIEHQHALAPSHTSARRAKCAAAARRHEHRLASRSCAAKKSKTTAPKRKVYQRRPSSRGSFSPAIAAPGAQAPVRSGSPPAQAEPTASETTPASPGGSNTSPVEISPSEPTTPAPLPESVEALAPFRYFSPTSFWNEPLQSSASLDPSSAAVVDSFNEAIKAAKEVHKGPAINTTAWSTPIYQVPVDQPTVYVKLERAFRSPGLQTAWASVPLPANAQPAAGTDEHLVVWQPSTDRLWEFWRLEHATSGWKASWGGAIQNVSSASGAYGPEAWPSAESKWGASASSLSIAGGLITLEDLELGQINHALAMGVPNARAGVYAAPAQRTDGSSTGPLSLPEGAHLRLDPSLDLASLHLPRLTLMLAEAAQRYGIVVRDTAGNVAFYAQDPIPTGTEPYAGPNGYFEGKSPSQLLASFPWSHLQLLKMDLHSTS